MTTTRPSDLQKGNVPEKKGRKSVIIKHPHETRHEKRRKNRDENKDKKLLKIIGGGEKYQNALLRNRMLGRALGLSFRVGNCRLARSLQPDEGHCNFNLCG